MSSDLESSVVSFLRKAFGRAKADPEGLAAALAADGFATMNDVVCLHEAMLVRGHCLHTHTHARARARAHTNSIMRSRTRTSVSGT